MFLINECFDLEEVLLLLLVASPDLHGSVVWAEYAAQAQLFLFPQLFTTITTTLLLLQLPYMQSQPLH